MSDLKTSLAFCVRKFLTKFLTPLTGLIQRQELREYSYSLSTWEKIKYHTVRWISWRCCGVITFAYPEIPYHPIQARRQEHQREWASTLLGIPSKKLKENSTEFLIKEQHAIVLKNSQPRTLPTFTILICFHHHLNYFKDCLRSVQEALRRTPSTQVEILLIHDDPSIDLSPLLGGLDFSFRQKIILRSHSKNHGICSSLNEGILHAQGEWLIYLDCDDLLEPDVFLILEKTIRKHPQSRFISSRAADIDVDGDILFWRLRSEQPYELIKNNCAGHLKVIKKELHQELGLFKQTFEGCQDYEFALRAAIHEPLLFIPHYLYRYRWHHDTQTVSHNERQNLTAMRIRQSYLLAIYWLTHGISMIEWQVTGPEAASWEQHLALEATKNFQKNSSSQTRYQVTLEADTPYDARRWKLLLVELATMIIDCYRESNTNISLLFKA